MMTFEELEAIEAAAEAAYDDAFVTGVGIREAKAVWQRASAAVAGAWNAERVMPLPALRERAIIGGVS
jgi:hypothetical protein